MTIEKMLVRLANLGRPIVVGYEPVAGTWTLRMARNDSTVLTLNGSVLKEVVREAHADRYAA